MENLLYKDEVFAIVGAAMEVHRMLGCGFLEAVYQEALEIELANRKIPFCAAKEINIFYKGKQLKKIYVADFLVFDKIVVEIKAINELSSIEEAQILNYLKATGLELGLLINFGEGSLKWKRMILTRHQNPIREIREISG